MAADCRTAPAPRPSSGATTSGGERVRMATAAAVASLPTSPLRSRLPQPGAAALDDGQDDEWLKPAPLRRTKSEEPQKASAHILNMPYSDVTEKYFLGRLLGEGMTSVVRHCIDRRTGEAYACKTLPKIRMTCASDVAELRSEVAALRRVSRHASIAGLRAVTEDDESVHIIMDLCEGGDLFDRIQTKGSFPEVDAARVCRQLLSVVHYCHSKGIMHRDLKPENILLTSQQSDTMIKVVDFGTAVFFDPGAELTQIVGSPYYIAPEVLNRSYGLEADMWSVGVVLYILLSGSPPFWAEERDAIFEKVRSGEFNIETGPWRRISSDAKDLVRRMLCLDPSKRITPQAAKGHPWIQLHCRTDGQQLVSGFIPELQRGSSVGHSHSKPREVGDVSNQGSALPTGWSSELSKSVSLSPEAPSAVAPRNRNFNDVPPRRPHSASSEGALSPCHSSSSRASSKLSTRSQSGVAKSSSGEQQTLSSTAIVHHRALYQSQWTASYNPRLRDRAAGCTPPLKTAPRSLLRHKTVPVPPAPSQKLDKGLPPSWRFNGRRFRAAEPQD